jgi:nitroimidazol reductase NimA-like FMN-containing flavoprotein (pyridoxamine 5'-phosphate oxidase superfamily)
MKSQYQEMKMKENDADAIKAKIQSLFLAQKLGVLCTGGNNGPYANLISFADQGDLRHILFVTPKKTRKYQNMQEDPRVAVLVENSRNTMEDFKVAVAVTATGRVKELTGEDRRSMARHYLGKHPNLMEFIDSPESALMDMAVETLVLVENFQTVTKIILK